MRAAITLDKVDLVCADTVRSKPAENDAGFVTYSKTKYFSSLCLDNYVYLIKNDEKLWGNMLLLGLKNWEE